MNCPVCDGNIISKLKSLYDDRYAYPGYFNVLKCRECDHLFLENSLSKEEITGLYTNYYPRSSLDIDNYRPHRASSPSLSWLNGEKASAFRWVPENIRILDIGCGFGEALGYHADRGCNVYGVETDKNILRVSKKYNYNVHVGSFDAAQYQPKYFDYVTMDQVIEHMVSPLNSLRDISKILRPGGYLVISTPNVKGWGAKLFRRRWIHWHAHHHLQYFSKKSLEILARTTNFKVVNVYSITNSEWLYYQWLHVLMYPASGELSIFWNKKNELPKWKKILLRIIMYLHKLKINHILTRFFDSIGCGDNYVYILEKK